MLCMIMLFYRVVLFSGPPPNLTKSQAHYKLLDLGNLGGGPVQFIQGLGLSKIRGGPEKKPPCILHCWKPYNKWNAIRPLP